MKVCDLIGPALDWAVAKCAEYPMGIWYDEDGLPMVRDDEVPEWQPSTNWCQGGPIIEHEGIALWQDEETLGWFASADEGRGNDYLGPTPLIAAMRCYVASKLGDEIHIPAELL